MRLTIFALMLTTMTAAPAQQFKSDTEYVLTMPKGEASWFLAAKCSDARWLYLATAHEREVWGGIPAALKGGWVAYQSNKRVHVRQQTEECAEVEILGESSQYGWVGGWVDKALVRLNPEDQKKVDAARKQEATKRAATAAAKREQDLKEQQYIASLPKLRGSSESVIVATSQDCAVDYARVVEFGKRNGTGVEYRKRVLELISLQCAISLPSGTPIQVRSRDAQFVSFSVYSGPHAGTRGIALKENVQ